MQGPSRRRTAADETQPTVALRIARDMGLLSGPKSKHLNAKVSPKLFEAAARRVGTFSPAVVINALAGRGPTILRTLLESMSQVFVAAPARAELAWLSGRLDPVHPGPGRVLATYEALLSRIDPAKVLVPTDPDWLAGGALAGHAARIIAEGGGKIVTAFDCVELISDALTATLTAKARFTLITEDTDFVVLAQLLPDLKVLFYARRTAD